MPLIVSLIFALAFAANVAAGAFTGSAPLGDVSEMLLLLAASAAFVIAILRSESVVRNR